MKPATLNFACFDQLALKGQTLAFDITVACEAVAAVRGYVINNDGMGYDTVVTFVGTELIL